MSFAPGVNVIYGENASGKTNLLEALFYFASGKSFRGGKERELIRLGETRAKAELLFSAHGLEKRMALTLEKGKKRELSVGGVKVQRLSEYLGLFRAVIFTPDHLDLVKGVSENRRRFLDLAICQSFPRYAASLNEYSRLLMQKNAVLRYVTCNTLEIQVGTERWRMERMGKEEFRLLHNSYLIVNYQRYAFTKKFHEQLIQGEPTFHNVVKRILSYDSEYHVQKLSRTDECEFNRGLKLAPENELLRPETEAETFRYPTMARVKGKGIWFDYYTYIDCTGMFAQKAFIQQNIRIRQLLELPCGATDYVLICCKVPKWQRRRFRRAMEEVKTCLYSCGYQRGFVAMEVVVQFLMEQGIRVAQ